MHNSKEFETARDIFSQAGLNQYFHLQDQHHVRCRPKDLLKWIKLLWEDLEYLTLVDMFACQTKVSDSPYQYEVVYHFLNMGNHQRLNIHVELSLGELLPSISGYFKHAEWMEREQSEMFGLSFTQAKEALLLPEGQVNFPLRKKALTRPWPARKEKKLPALRKNPNKSEAPYPEESFKWKSYPLLHPNTRGLFEWMVCFDPLKVVQSRIEIGFHYQALEKLFEQKNWLHLIQLADKIHLGAAPTYSIAWVKNLEDMIGIKPSERAQAIRIILLELARIAEHLTVMQEMVSAINLEESILFINAREKIYELFERFCGHRQGFGIVKLGGLKEDIPHGWIIEYQSTAQILKRTLPLIHKSLISKQSFRSHLEQGHVSAQSVLQWGVSGPTMRASGLNFDLRKSQPFYFYQDIDFDVPVGINGTAYDRYLIRFEEVFQSLRIITQVVDNLPLGEVDAGEAAAVALKQVVPHQLQWHYAPIESPNGEAGFFMLLDENLSPSRIKIKTPSFPLAQALPQFMKGLKESQLKPCLASLGIRATELDR